MDHPLNKLSKKKKKKVHCVARNFFQKSFHKFVIRYFNEIGRQIIYLGGDFRRVGRNIMVVALIGYVGNYISRVARFQLTQRGQLYSGVVHHSYDGHAHVYLETVDNGEPNRAHNRHYVSYRKSYGIPCFYNNYSYSF